MSHGFDRLSIMTNAQPLSAGWYPDPNMGGTRYWDGNRWSGHHRPQRATFAAQSAHRGWGIGLAIFGALLIITSPGQLEVKTDADGDTTGGPGSLALGITLALGLLALGIYLFRGRGVSTKMAVAEAKALAIDAEAREDKARAASLESAHANSAPDVERIKALANPETAKALQNLQSLLFTRVISDEEFNRAKARLLGESDLRS
jgi:hypothetical protein